MSCDVGHRYSSYAALRLWHWPAALIPIQPTPSLGTSICYVCSPKKKLKRRCGTHTDIHTHTHTQWNNTHSQKEWNFASICSNMDGLGGLMLSEITQRRTNTGWYHLQLKSKKYNKLLNIIERRSILTDIENKLVVTSGEGQRRGFY